jgi:hypothetical protein
MTAPAPPYAGIRVLDLTQVLAGDRMRPLSWWTWEPRIKSG